VRTLGFGDGRQAEQAMPSASGRLNAHIRCTTKSGDFKIRFGKHSGLVEGIF